MIVTGERVAQFVSQRLGLGLCPPYTSMGIDRGGEIVAGVIFHCFEGHAVHVTAAGRGWTAGFIRAVGAYVFGQLGCIRITVTTADPEVARYAERLGGVVEGRLRDQFGPGNDGIIVGILKAAWKYGRLPALQRG